MLEVIGWDEMARALPAIDLMTAIEEGFAAYSSGRATVARVSELRLPRGEVHVKSGFIAGDTNFVVKVAGGFYGNPGHGLSSSNGLMVLFDAETGVPIVLLDDHGHLTDIRTAVAGAIAAKYLAPQTVSAIGIIGTGIQARLQAEYLLAVRPAKRLFVYGRTAQNVRDYRRDLAAKGFEVIACNTPAEVAQNANLLVTTTPASTPLLRALDIAPGTHITAVGSDSPEKNELEAALLAKADKIVVDSLSQCQAQGELHHAMANNIASDRIVELGDVIRGRKQGRESQNDITVADLTGVAVQDIKIAQAIFEAVKARRA